MFLISFTAPFKLWKFIQFYIQKLNIMCSSLQVNAFNSDKKKIKVEEVAMGFVRVANEAMCRPIRALTQVYNIHGVHVVASVWSVKGWWCPPSCVLLLQICDICFATNIVNLFIYFNFPFTYLFIFYVSFYICVCMYENWQVLQKNKGKENKNKNACSK